MNRTGSKILHGLLLVTTGLVGSTVVASTAAMAGGGPTGGSVAVGSATIINASPTQTVVNQSSKKALINWQSFSVPTGSSVQFNQPTSKSLTVNRVTGSDASVINGALQANGNVWLLNANGVLFGKGSQINVGALLATTSDLSDEDFKNGKYTFKPSASSNASVVNKGSIVVSQGGSVVLSAPQVSNEGLIQADLGTVVLGGAKAFTVDMTGDNLLTYQVTKPVSDAPKNANGSVAAALVSNSGTIMAAGGHVVMTARAARNVQDNVINNSGMVEATSVSSHNGVIDLDAGPDGTVNNSGTLQATGSAQGETGGSINVTGGTVNIADGAKVDASGQSGGGTVQIGGGLHGQGTLAHAQNTTVGDATISADATGKGDGGTVAIWSDGNTSFAGSVTARGGAQGGNGGRVETSGHNLGVSSDARVDTSAPLGLTGDWLLDPANLFLTSNTSQPACCGSTCVNVSSIMTSLASTNVSETASNSITLDTDSDITWNSSHSLSLLTQGSITVSSNIQNSGSGGVYLVAGWDGTTTDFSGAIASGAYGSSGGDITIDGNFVAVGSASGRTVVAGDNVTLDAQTGYGQIGFHDATGGEIQVLAKDQLLVAGDLNSTIAQIGNGGTTSSGDIAGNITISAGSLQMTGTGGIVAIGNIGGDSTSSESGHIQVNAGSITLSAPDGLGASMVQIGNWSAEFSSGNATGAIDVTTNGTLSLSALGDSSRTIIGNGGSYFDESGNEVLTSNTAGGNITVQAKNVSLTAGQNDSSTPLFAQSRIGQRSRNNSSGDIAVSAVGDANVTIAITANGTDLASIGNGIGLNTATSSGNISVSSTGSIAITGNDSGQARIATGYAANSTITVNAAGSISLAVNGTPGSYPSGAPATGQALIGSFGNGAANAVGGNISVTSANGSVSLQANEDGSLVSIGNANGAATTGGNVRVSAVNGTVSLYANGSVASGFDSDTNSTIAYDAVAEIGNASATGNVSGATTVIARNLTIDATATDATAFIGLLGESSTGSQSGNIKISVSQDMDVAASGESSVAQIGNWSDASTSGGAVGTINITVGSILELDATGDGAHASIGHGGPQFKSLGQTGGNIVLTAGAINLTASDPDSGASQASIGSRGLGQIVGNISLTTTSGDISIHATGGDLASVGNRGGLSTSSSSGVINVLSSGAIDLTAVDTGEVRISGGLASNSTINVTAAGDILLQVTGDPNGGFVGQAHIGSFGNNQSNAGGNISVTSTGGSISLEAAADESRVYIGNGSGLNSTGGNIVVTAGNLSEGDIALVAGGENSFVQIGNAASGGTINGDITLLAGHDLTLDASANGTIVQIGNGAPYDSGVTGGNISGNISLTVKHNLTFIAGAYDSIEQVGNGDPNYDRAGNVSGDIAISVLGNTDAQNGAWIGNTADGIETGNVTVITQSGSLSGEYFTDDLGTSAGTGGNVFIGFTGTSGTYHFNGIGEYTSANTFTWAAAASLDVIGITQNSGTGNINLVAGWDGHTTDLGSLANAGVYGNHNGVLTIDGYIFDTAVGSKSGRTTALGYDVDVVAVTGGEGFAQLGYNDSGATGAIVVRAVHDVSVLGGDSSSDCTDCTPTAAYAQIGNGGAFITGSDGGAISVKAGGNITVVGGQSTYDYAQIGNGGDAGLPGAGTVGDSGNIVVTAGGSITVTGGIDYAQIGNGGWGSNGSSGNVTVKAGGNITITGGSNSSWGYAQIGNGGQSSIGSATGDISVTANGTLKLVGGNNGMYAQIGNGGDQHSSQSSSSGNISIVAGNLTLVGASSLGSNGEGYALIGNTAVQNTSTAGNGNASTAASSTATGNISIVVAGTTKIQSTDGQGDAWIGNSAINGSATGDLSVITGAIDDSADQNDDVSQFIVADLGGGNVTIGTTNATVTNSIGGLIYNSANALTIVSAGNVIIDDNIQNAGSGNVTIVAGWNTAISPSAVLSSSGAYGVGGKSLTVGGTTAAGSVSVGSKSGTTNLLAGSLIVSANNGNAQVGYAGAGIGAINIKTTGDIAVLTEANNTVALIGNGGYGLTGTLKGDISIAAGGNVTVQTDSSSSIADIGIIGGDGSSQSGNITISAGGKLSVVAQNSTSNAQVGNQQAGAGTPSQRGDASGNIKITAGSVLISASGTNTGAVIGNGNSLLRNANASGNITLNTGSLTIASSSTSSTGTVARLGSRGYSSANGNIAVTATGNVSLSAGNYGNAILGDGSYGTVAGDIAVVSGGAVSLNANGTSSQARIGQAAQGATSGNITITNVGALSLGANGTSSLALIGQNAGGTASGNITVASGGAISLTAGGSSSEAQIGQDSSSAATGNILLASGGAVSINANGTASQAQVGNSGTSASGSLTVAAGAVSVSKVSGATSLIGGLASSGSLSGNVTISAGTIQGIEDSIANDIVGGDFALYASGGGTLNIGNVGTYDSAHDLSIVSAGDLDVTGSVQNSGAGDITLIAAHTLTVGGSNASGNAAVGSASGTTQISAADIQLLATHGYAQIGYHGGGSGAIVVQATDGDIALAGGDGTGFYAQIGDGGYGVSGSSSAPITVEASNDIALKGGAGQEAYAQIGNGGAESNSNTDGYSETGDISVADGGGMTLQAGTGQGSYVQVGNGGYLSGQSLNGTATIGGNISVISFDALNLLGGGDDAYAQIGNGGDFVNKNVASGSSGTISGDISVEVQAPNVPGEDQLTLTAGTGVNSYTQIGNGGQGENLAVAGATVAFTISGDVSIADLTLSGSDTGANGYAQIGNGDASKTGTGDVSGSVTLGSGTKVTNDPGKAPGASASFGNATGDGSVSGTVASGGVDAGTQGSVASITQTSTNPTTTYSIITVTAPPGAVQQLASIETVKNGEGPSPLDKLSDNSEQEMASDTVADSVGKSLGEGKTYVTSTTLIPGLLKQMVTLTPNHPNGVPPADVDYSSWGNEALWRW